MPCASSEHVRSTNPRHVNSCVKCGRLMPPLTDHAPRQRIPEAEREYIEHAAKGVVNPEPLIEHAQTRALRFEGVDPLTLRAGIDWLKEAREELSDCANYLVWHLQEHLQDEDRAHRVMQALRHITIAYDLIRES